MKDIRQQLGNEVYLKADIFVLDLLYCKQGEDRKDDMCISGEKIMVKKRANLLLANLLLVLENDVLKIAGKTS